VPPKKGKKEVKFNPGEKKPSFFWETKEIPFSLFQGKLEKSKGVPQ